MKHTVTILCIVLGSGLLGYALGRSGWPVPSTPPSPAALTEPPWRPMTSAPRDGTVVELRCTYGVRPWYGLFRWTDSMEMLDQQGALVTMYMQSPWWASLKRPGQGMTDDKTLMWRPYEGDPGAYIDPTQGAQETAAYWRGER